MHTVLYKRTLGLFTPHSVTNQTLVTILGYLMFALGIESNSGWTLSSAPLSQSCPRQAVYGALGSLILRSLLLLFHPC